MEILAVLIRLSTLLPEQNFKTNHNILPSATDIGNLARRFSHPVCPLYILVVTTVPPSLGIPRFWVQMDGAAARAKKNKSVQIFVWKT
jgi:hypothetical protein